MFLGIFKSINFAFSFIAIIACYLLLLLVALVVAFSLKSYLIEKEMDKKIKKLNENLTNKNEQLAANQREIRILTKALKL